MAKKSLFGKNVSPSCSYCRHSALTPDKLMVLCPKCGLVSAQYQCKKFLYDPLKREPKLLKDLPRYRKEDFAL